MPTTRLILQSSFWAQKHGNYPSDYEDHAAFHRGASPDDPGRRITALALADGATESAYASLWARSLTTAAVRHLSEHRAQPPTEEAPDPLAKWLPDAIRRWNELVPWSHIPWHAESKVLSGSLAAVITIRAAQSPNGPAHNWRATAVGDSCLFLVDGQQLMCAFPLTTDSQFNSTPNLLSSNPDKNPKLHQLIRTTTGQLEPGQHLIVASDAVSQWALRRQSRKDPPWAEIASLTTSQWEDWLSDQRRAGMPNDDVTIMIATVR